MTNYDIEKVLDEMAVNLKAKFANTVNSGSAGRIESAEGREPLMIGIHTGGVWVAAALHKRMELTEPLSTLNISFYRDDFTRIGMHPQVLPSQVHASTEGRAIILVDDVLFTGRTIRAAINEIFDYGRPASITLATLVERDGRELPVQADVVGLHMSLKGDQQVKLTGPTPLAFSFTGEGDR